jgi:glycosyltransferase involved in cell wall biosynthesis
MTRLRVLHVVATTQRRGAEMFAADLVRALDGLGTAQQVASLRSAGGPAVDFDAPTHILGGGRLTPSARLSRLVRRLRPDLIQAHGGEAMKFSMLARPDAPIVYRRIGGAPPALRNGWRRAGYRQLVRRTARVVAVAEAVRRESIALFGISPDRIVTIPNAVDADRLIAHADPSMTRKGLGVEEAAPVVLSMGALTREKDPPALLRVAAETLRRLPDAVYVVVGDGPMRSRMEAKVSSLGLRDRVRMLGVRTDVPDLLSMADALLFASRPDGMEGMPASLIEAGMLGTPTVAYDVAGVGEVVIDGRTGRLAPWGAERNLVDALVDLLSNRATRDAMGEAAAQRCLTEFSIDRVATRYLDVYRDVRAG